MTSTQEILRDLALIVGEDPTVTLLAYFNSLFVMSSDVRRDDGSTAYAFTIKHTRCLIFNYDEKCK